MRTVKIRLLAGITVHIAVPAQIPYKFNLKTFFMFSCNFVVERKAKIIPFFPVETKKRLHIKCGQHLATINRFCSILHQNKLVKTKAFHGSKISVCGAQVEDPWFMVIRSVIT